MQQLLKHLTHTAPRAYIGRHLRNRQRRLRAATIGHDFIDDVRERLCGLEITNIFDVGAHIGLTAMEFSDRFPEATLYAFEPGSMNFRNMTSNLVGNFETQ